MFVSASQPRLVAFARCGASWGNFVEENGRIQNHPNGAAQAAGARTMSGVQRKEMYDTRARYGDSRTVLLLHALRRWLVGSALTCRLLRPQGLGSQRIITPSALPARTFLGRNT